MHSPIKAFSLNSVGASAPGPFSELSVFRCRVMLMLLETTKYTANVQGGPKKRHKVYGTIILQPYVTESCGFQQNVPKEIFYMT